MTEREELLRYRFAADKASIAALKADFQTIKADIGSLSAVQSDLNRRLGDIDRTNKIDALGARFGKLGVEIKNADAAAQMLAERLQKIGASGPEIDRAAAAFSNASAAASGGEGGGRGINLTAIGSKIRSLPSTQIPGTGLATDAIGNILRVLGALPPAALPVIGVLGGVVAGFVLLNKSLEDVKKAAQNAAKSNQDYYDAIGQSKTTEEAKARIEELNRLIKAQSDATANATTATGKAFEGAQQQFGDLGARLLFAIGGVGQSSEDAKKKLDEYNAELQGLQRAVDDNALAAADLAAQEEKLREIRDKNADQQIAREIQNSQFLRSGTEDSVQARIDSLLEENMAIAKVVTTVGLSNEEVGKLTDKLTENNAQLQDLQTNVLGVVRARDADIQAAKDQEAAMKDAQKVMEDAQKATAKETEDLIKIQEKYAESVAKLKDNLEQANIEAAIKQQQKLADLLTDLQQKQADDATNYAEKQDEALEKFNESRIDIEENYRKRVLEIEKEYTRSSTDAIQNRDAVALDAAKRKRQEDLDDAGTKRDEDEKAREKDYQNQLKELKQNFEQQQKQRVVDYQRRLADADLQFRREAEQRQRKYNYDLAQLAQAQAQDIQERKAAYNKQISDLKTYLTTQKNLEEAHYDLILKYANDSINKLNDLLGIQSGNAIGNTDVGSFFGGSTKTGMDSIGNGLNLLSRQPSASGGGVNVTVNGVGLGKRKVIELVTKKLNDVWNEAGIA